MKKEPDKIEYIEEDAGSDTKRQIKKLQKILKTCKAERHEYLEGWQRARADQQNYIKQKDKEMQDFRKFALRNTALQIIPVLDNLVLACESVPQDMKDHNWVSGIAHIKKQFESVFRDIGLEEIEVKHGGRFDPEYHEAAGEAESGGESGTITEVLRRGYTLSGKVIRPARVKVIK